MKNKTALVRIVISDEHVMDDGRVSPIDKIKLEDYLNEILEVPQHPEAEPGEGYYLTELQVLDISE